MRQITTIHVLLLALITCNFLGETYAQSSVAPMLVNTNMIGQVGDQQTALTVKGPVVIGAYGLNPENDGDYDDDDDGQFDEVREERINIAQDGRMDEVLLWVERGIVGSVMFSDISDWGDYVFEESYDLMPLLRVKNYVETNNHLPGVPSAQAIMSKGYSGHEMNKTMMVKIEELVLYTLEQQERIEALHKEAKGKLQALTSLEERINVMKGKLGLSIDEVEMDLKLENYVFEHEPNKSANSKKLVKYNVIQTQSLNPTPQPIHETTYAGKVGANSDHVEEGTVFNIRGKTLIVPLSASQLPELRGYNFDPEDPEQENFDFSLYIDGNFVAGDVTSRNLQDEWPDYVFNSQYELLPLDQVRQFVSTNKHLPKMPSAQELYENGYKEFDMKRKFLVKIEELFLYQIEQQKQINKLSHTLNFLEHDERKRLKNELSALQNKMRAIVDENEAEQ